MKKDLLEIQLACFNLGENLFAVDIMRIKEIIEPHKIASLPWTSRFLEGVINLRGMVVPVMDMRKRFGMAPMENRGTEKLLLVTLFRQLLALQVDDVQEVITVAAVDIKPAPDVDSEPGAECLLGVCLSGGKLYMILDIDSLLAPGEVSELQLARG
jgi:purine-binding chemotaxis protein CheW